jgi:hypothetical protein
MNPVPIYDASAPIACTIGNHEIPERIELVERMRANLRAIERTSDGLLLHFPPTADIDADIRRFTIDEKRCCQFWGFTVKVDDRELSLRWDGPPATRALLDRLHAYFIGTEPLRDLAGLL